MLSKLEKIPIMSRVAGWVVRIIDIVLTVSRKTHKKTFFDEHSIDYYLGAHA